MSYLIVNLVRNTEIIFHTFKVFTAEVSTIEPTTVMKEGWSKGHQSPYYWASSQCWSKFLLPGIDFVIIFPVLMCCPAKGRHYGEVLFNLLYGWYGGTDVLFLLLVNKTKHLIAFFSHSSPGPFIFPKLNNFFRLSSFHWCKNFRGETHKVSDNENNKITLENYWWSKIRNWSKAPMPWGGHFV